MKNFIFLSLLAGLLGYSKLTFSQNNEKVDSLGLPGDNLNLYVVLQLFQESKTLDDFEKKLNQESLKVNNLDLNNDDKIDYIKVVDHTTDGTHAIVLQTPVNNKEVQDIAVIEVEKDKAGKVVVQIVGNEELYGKDYIIEPKENDAAAKQKATSDYSTVKDESPKVYVNINVWPVVEYLYAPDYVIYVSPWYWSYYPVWWSPWEPWYWHNYYYHHYHHHHHHYYGYYHRTYTYRAPEAQTYYGPRRSSSTYVQKNRDEGRYIRTYRREPTNVDQNISTRPIRANPGYQNPSVQPPRNQNPVSPREPRVKPSREIKPTPEVKPNPEVRPTRKIQPVPGVQPKPNIQPRSNPQINKPMQQPRQNHPPRQPGQNR